jgi:hypothetical protein
MLELTIDEKDVQIQELLGDRQTISPYRLANLTSVLVGRYVREQMVYQYVQKGFISSSLNEDGKIQVDRAEAHRWMKKYSTKNG